MPKKKATDQLAIGTPVHIVMEHLYYIHGRTGPLKEYCVCDGVITGYYEGGYTEAIVKSNDPGGIIGLHYCKADDIGKRKCFLSAAEAARYAQEITTDYERRWGWLGEPDIPLRRPWAHLLKEEQHHE